MAKTITHMAYNYNSEPDDLLGDAAPLTLCGMSYEDLVDLNDDEVNRVVYTEHTVNCDKCKELII